MSDKPTFAEREYDKGERRFKHVGKGPKPYIEFDARQPRKWVGKCPDSIPDSKKKELLNRAIAAPNGRGLREAPLRCARRSDLRSADFRCRTQLPRLSVQG